MIKAISFDLDGTLVDDAFDQAVWNEELPKLYAKKHKIPNERAKEIVFADYYRAEWIEKMPDWTNIERWMERLHLGSWKPLIKRLNHCVFRYSDVLPTLENLKGKYSMVLLSSAHPAFLNAKLESQNLKGYFAKIFSAPVYNFSRKHSGLYTVALRELKLKPHELAHVGDDHEFDYRVPRELGIHAFHLLRGKKRKGENELTSLTQLPERIARLESQ